MRWPSFVVAAAFAALTYAFWGFVNQPTSEPAWPSRIQGFAFSPYQANQDATLDDMPEMREPVLEWRPVGYATHFRMTGFRDRDLAVAAYESVPDAVKVRFFAARREVELAIIDVQDLMEAAPEASSRLAARAPEIFAAIARLGGVISGGEARAADTQSDVDSLFS